MNELEQNYLAHHGILNQRWHHRNGPPYTLDRDAHSKEEKKTLSKSLSGERHEEMYDRKAARKQKKEDKLRKTMVNAANNAVNNQVKEERHAKVLDQYMIGAHNQMSIIEGQMQDAKERKDKKAYKSLKYEYDSYQRIADVATDMAEKSRKAGEKWASEYIKYSNTPVNELSKKDIRAGKKYAKNWLNSKEAKKLAELRDAYKENK